MNEVLVNAIGPILAAFTAGGGAWFGLKYRLNGTAGRVERIEETTDKIWDKVNDTNNRLTALEIQHIHLSDEVVELKTDCKEKHG